MAGVLQIVRFNWPFYAAAITGVLIALLAVATMPLGVYASWPVLAAAAAAAFWIGSSLGASWLVYDRSPLTRWTWIRDVLPIKPRAWITVHAGLDESTPVLRDLLGADGRVFDIFDPVEMTEPSILRARSLARNAVEAERVDWRALPVSTGTIDAALLLLSAHELRTEHARRTLLGEVQRALAPAGRAIVAEHLRDGANFAAFGPGFLHFHSRRTWARAFAAAGLAIERELSITPFVHVFVLRRLRPQARGGAKSGEATAGAQRAWGSGRGPTRAK